MKYQAHVFFIVPALLLAAGAYADIGKVGGNIGNVGGIGKVGSPGVPSNVPKSPDQDSEDSDEDDKDSGNEKEAPKERPLLLSISFGKNRVNFQPELNQAIIQNEKDAQGTVYSVVSVIPGNGSSPSKGARMSGVYTQNLNAVIQQMQALGLPANRIQSGTVYNDDGSDQVVNIYGTPQ